MHFVGKDVGILACCPNGTGKSDSSIGLVNVEAVWREFQLITGAGWRLLQAKKF